jgi:2-oxoglutarate ferredoxin oxidoreductase subunit alpha
VHALGVPLSEIAASRYPDPKERQLLKNIMYVGVLAALLGIEPEVIAQLLGEQYKGKDKLIRPNLDAFQAGLRYVEHQFGGDIGLKVERRNNVGDRIFIEGNAAAALGAVYGGATVCAWYPITPSSSLAEAFQKYCARYRVDKATGKNKYAIVQAEDELSSIGMVIGAGWNGARAFTATSGPGVSLMSEFIGLAYFAEVPAVIVDVQRGGPSTGMPTRTQQSDLLSCAYASHGDTKHVLLFPEDPYECFEFTAAALDLAERLQTPIFVMTDLDIGMNHRLCAPLKWDDSRRYDRGKVMTPAELDAGKEFGRYLDVDGDGVAYRTLPGAHATRGAYFTRGTTKDAHARYSEAGSDYVYNMERLLKKFDTAKKLVPQPIIRKASQKTPYGVIYYGSTSPSMNEALGALEQAGIQLDRLRVRAFPFPESVERFIDDHERVFVVEQNRDAQLRAMLVNELDMDPARLVPVLHYDGTPITARFIVKAIKEGMPGANVHRLSGGKAA